MMKGKALWSSMVAIVAIGFLASIPILIGRVMTESSSDTVEVTMDFDELAEFSREYAFPLEELLQRMRDAGLCSLAIEEMTLQRLEEEGTISVLAGYELASIARASPEAGGRLRRLLQDHIDPGFTYVIAGDSSTFYGMRKSLAERVPPDSLRFYVPGAGQEGPPFVIELLMSPQDARKLRLGLNEADIRLAKSVGLNVIPRFANIKGVGPTKVKEAFDSLEREAKIHTVIFSGDEVLGFPGALRETATELRNRGIALGLVEAPVQRGFILQRGSEELAKLMNYDVVRVYSISRLEIEKNALLPGDVVDRWPRAIQERNIRVVYLRPFFLEGPRQDVVELNVKYVRDVCESIRRAGYDIGAASPFKPFWPSESLLWVIVLGVAASVVFMLFLLLSPSIWLAFLLPVGVLGLVGIRALLGFDPVCKLSALASAVVFPAVGVVAAADFFERSVSRRKVWVIPFVALGGLTFATAVTLVGAAYVGALLSDVRYLLEIEFFRGVKLTYVAPLFLSFLVYVRNWGPPGRRDDEYGGLVLVRRFERILSEPIRFKHFLMFALMVIAGYVYLARSGHESGIEVSQLEIHLRRFLEQELFVRPRTKEFLIGHPLLMLMPLCFLEGSYGLFLLPCLLGSAIGQISVINSFEHLRTPFEVSVLRTFNGMWMGAIIGLILLCILSLIVSIFHSRHGRTSRHA